MNDDNHDRRAEWGPWALDLDTYEIVDTYASRYRYTIDLERCTDSARVLDFVCQIAGKSWADDRTVAGLVRVLDDALRPQANLCSFGAPSTMTRRELRRFVRDTPNRPRRRRDSATGLVVKTRENGVQDP